MNIARSYIDQAGTLAKEMGVQYSPSNFALLLNAILRMPDIVDSRKADVISEEEWPDVSAAFDNCLDRVNDYRSREGQALHEDVCSRVGEDTCALRQGRKFTRRKGWTTYEAESSRPQKSST